MSSHETQTGLAGIGSMATRLLMADLIEAYRQEAGGRVQLTSIGGVDAARRVRAGEAFDFVVLAAGALDRLGEEGHVTARRADIACSGMAVAVRAGGRHPGLATEASLREAMLEADRIAYSTGPSGDHLLRLLDRWDLAAALEPRLVLAPPGVPVGTLLARGEAGMGFQQLSEFTGIPGIEIAGPLPDPIQLRTIFSASVCTTSVQHDATSGFLDFLASDRTAEIKLRHGMAPA